MRTEIRHIIIIIIIMKLDMLVIIIIIIMKLDVLLLLYDMDVSCHRPFLPGTIIIIIIIIIIIGIGIA